jgi:hypothetical protein
MSAKCSGQTSAAEVLLNSKRVRERYGVVDMTLWRWLKDTELLFPAPIIIRERRYWRLGQLERWERLRARASRSA